MGRRALKFQAKDAESVGIAAAALQGLLLARRYDADRVFFVEVEGAGEGEVCFRVKGIREDGVF